MYRITNSSCFVLAAILANRNVDDGCAASVTIGPVLAAQSANDFLHIYPFARTRNLDWTGISGALIESAIAMFLPLQKAAL